MGVERAHLETAADPAYDRRMSSFENLLLASLLLGAFGCAEEVAVANLEPRNASGMTGKAIFTKTGDGVEVEITVENLAPFDANHAIHIHEVGNCGDEGMAAGPHWNPGGSTASEAHGMPGHVMSHLGDLGNMRVDATGKGEHKYKNPMWTMGDGGMTDILGHAVIIHEAEDDFGPVMYGNAKKRFGCGVIGGGTL
jgi:superoxide dismutase, Cu-Zn family